MPDTRWVGASLAAEAVKQQTTMMEREAFHAANRIRKFKARLFQREHERADGDEDGMRHLKRQATFSSAKLKQIEAFRRRLSAA